MPSQDLKNYTSVFIYFSFIRVSIIDTRSPFGAAKATDTGGDARKTSNCHREAAWLGTVRKVEWCKECGLKRTCSVFCGGGCGGGGKMFPATTTSMLMLYIC